MLNFTDLQFNFKNYSFDLVGYIEENAPSTYYQVDKGYVDKDTGKIFIFKNPDFKFRDFPIIYIKDGMLVKAKSNIKSINEEFTIEKEEYLKDYSLNHIINVSDENDVLYNREALEDINSATSKWRPPINDTDDPLKKIVKHTILEKDVNINKYKHITSKRHDITNLVSNLKSINPVTFRSFNIWAEMLGIDYIIITKDNGKDLDDPCDKVMVYTSDNNNVLVLDPDKIKLSIEGSHIEIGE